MIDGDAALEPFYVYVENVQRGPVGNAALWWKLGGCGYTCDLDQAQLFKTDDPILRDLLKSKKYRAWKREYVLKHTRTMVDVVDLDTSFAIKGE